MPLEDSCQQFEGKLSVVVPIYGYGWSKFEADDGDVPGEVPRRFDMRIREFWRFEESICGGIGVVECGHPALPELGPKPGVHGFVGESTKLQGYSVFFWVRDGWGKALCDLTTKPLAYDLWIGKGVPKASPVHALPTKERAQFDSWPVYQGPGYIAATIADLEGSVAHLGRLLI